MTDVVLVVEDEILIRVVIADYLRSCGYRVIEAASGEDVVKIRGSLASGSNVVAMAGEGHSASPRHR